MKNIISLLLLSTALFVNASDYYIKTYVSKSFTVTNMDGHVDKFNTPVFFYIYVEGGQEHCDIQVAPKNYLFKPVATNTIPLMSNDKSKIVILKNCEEIRESGNTLVSFIKFNYNPRNSRTVPDTITFIPLLTGLVYNFTDIESKDDYQELSEKYAGMTLPNNKILKIPQKVIENPINYLPDYNVHITRLLLFKDETIVEFYCNNRVDDETICEWYNINKDAYLIDKSDGHKYYLTEADNIEKSPLKSFFDINKDLDQKNFTLHFQPIPLITSTINFIEDEDSGWNIYDIIINDESNIWSNLNISDKQKMFYYSKKIAEEGNADAQFELGGLYERGIGIVQDFQQAAYWYKKAAEQGHIDAQFNLANCYFEGKGVERNQEQAVFWYRKAAEQGDAVAQFNLGVCYNDGTGVSQSDEQAVYWFEKSAEQGLAAAQYSLGVHYKKGYGVKQSYQQAVFWYKMAAEQGLMEAQYDLGCCYEEGMGTYQSHQQAAYWYKMAAEQGFSRAQNNLGVCYALGRGVEKSGQQAVFWWKKAAAQGNINSLYSLGICFYEGDGVKQSNKEAKYWLQKAAEKGHKEAQNILERIK